MVRGLNEVPSDARQVSDLRCSSSRGKSYEKGSLVSQGHMSKQLVFSEVRTFEKVEVDCRSYFRMSEGVLG